tara:strand:- start:120 stop:995 length:876 start_codon:yes stop_codon:yes gene_type:complete
MSRTLKRPMFRKGGEVMEGIMTGIKPRKMYSFGTGDQGVVDDVSRKMNLIDVVAGTGSSPLGDPLTQFLLSTGQNLISGDSAGGTKLQELVGATKQPLDRAMKMQQLKDMERRKLATALISKSKVSDVRKLYNALKTRINPKTGKLYTLEDVAGDKAMTDLYKKETSPFDRTAQKEKRIEDDLGKYKDFLNNPDYNPLQKRRVRDEILRINNNAELDEQIDTNNPFVGVDDYKEIGTQGMKDPEGKEIKLRVFEPDDKEDFQLNKLYYLYDQDIYVRYNSAKNILVEDPNY